MATICWCNSNASRKQIVRERTGDADVTIADAPWTSTVGTNQRMVERYRSGRILLAGDAAHVHSPLGGQGMNLGIQDAYNLAWKLALVTDETAPDELLKTYAKERMPAAEAVISQIGTSGTLLVTANPVVNYPTLRATENNSTNGTMPQCRRCTCFDLMTTSAFEANRGAQIHS